MQSGSSKGSWRSSRSGSRVIRCFLFLDWSSEIFVLVEENNSIKIGAPTEMKEQADVEAGRFEIVVELSGEIAW